MKKIESIQVLRAFAAVSVVLTHMSFIKSGGFGVEIFFVISGFLMMYSTEKGLGRGVLDKKNYSDSSLLLDHDDFYGNGSKSYAGFISLL